MVQSRNGHKRLPAFLFQYAFYCIQHTTDHVAGRFINPLHRRGITTIQVTFSRGRQPDNALDIGLGMKTLDHCPLGRNGHTLLHLPVQSRGTGVLPEGPQPIRTKRVSFAEAVTGEIITNVDTEGCWHMRKEPLFILSFPPSRE